MFLLECPTQAYAWGSADAIPIFQRRPAKGGPVAELWLGTHPMGTAKIVDGHGQVRLLTEVAGELDYMLKVLAADRPLSVQVHPNSVRAVAGFAAEEARGVPMTAPERVFKDPRPEPEMVVALSTFDTLVGFRSTAEILRVLEPVAHPITDALTEQLRRDPGFAGFVRLVEGLLLKPPDAADIAAIVDQCREALADGIDIRRAYATAVDIEQFFAGDVGVLVSLLLNRLTLQPGEAAYLGTGIIHAHLRGLCLEVMVSSDNVLRAGLTTKHTDPVSLVTCLEEGMSPLARVTPQVFGTSTEIFSPTNEFALSLTQSSQADPGGVVLPGCGARLLMCTGGEVALLNEGDEMLRLQRGDAAYAGDVDGELRIMGTGELAQAYAPAGAGGRLETKSELVPRQSAW